MQKMPAQALLQVIQTHITALNNHKPDAFMATFAPSALVNDAKREFLGLPAIQAWADAEIFGDNISLDIKEAFDQSGSTIVRFRVDGNFDKSKLPDPLILTYYFTVQNNLITQLIIVNNSKNAS